MGLSKKGKIKSTLWGEIVYLDYDRQLDGRNCLYIFLTTLAHESAGIPIKRDKESWTLEGWKYCTC
jgi:hypothetical protein